MNKKHLAYCGLYCENCAVKAKVNPAATLLYAEMRKAGFEHVMRHLPDGEAFWRFLKGTVENIQCVCRENSCGNPGCKIRVCAKEKNMDACPFCEDYPCEYFDVIFKMYPVLREDNDVLRKHGFEAWGELQDDRRANGFIYTETYTKAH